MVIGPWDAFGQTAMVKWIEICRDMHFRGRRFKFKFETCVSNTHSFGRFWRRNIHYSHVIWNS